jgi:hypothetical protein
MRIKSYGCLHMHIQHTTGKHSHAREAAGAYALWPCWCLNECIDIAIAGLRFNFLAHANKSCEFQHIFPHPLSLRPHAPLPLSVVRIFIAWNAKQPAWSVAVNAQRAHNNQFLHPHVTNQIFYCLIYWPSRCVQRFRLMKRFHTLLSGRVNCVVSVGDADYEFCMFFFGNIFTIHGTH